MKKNIGSVDRIVRILLGLGLAGYGLYAQHWIGFVAAIPLGTALLSWCPLYVPIKLNTGAKES